MKFCLEIAATVQVDAIKKDSSRVVQENNALHAQLIQRDEESDVQQAEQYQRVKELESEIAELSFWKHQASARMEQVERSKCDLKERLADLMKLGMVKNFQFQLGCQEQCDCRLVQLPVILRLRTNQKYLGAGISGPPVQDSGRLTASSTMRTTLDQRQPVAFV